MTTCRPNCIEETNLSMLWARAFLETLQRPGGNPAPLMFTVTGFDGSIPERKCIRVKVDEILAANGKNSIAVSALVVFPYEQWLRRGCPPAAGFFEWCLNRFGPRLKARDRRNCHGLYFERMMAFDGLDPHGDREVKNQLCHIIKLWREREAVGKRPRQSALEVTCFDPPKDQRGQPRSGFPCLQQVSFGYDNAGGLAISAFYPTQYIFDRAYGNFLGLCGLGLFMAKQLGLELVRFNGFVGRAQLGSITKQRLAELQHFLQPLIPESQPARKMLSK